MKPTRRSILTGLGAVAAASTAGSLWRTRSARGEDKTVIYWGHNYPSRVKIVNEIMVPGFKRDSGIAVVHNDFETNQMETKILTGWTGGQGGPDLISVGDYNLANYASRKLIAPVDPTAFGFKSKAELVAAYEPGSLDGFTYKGELYGIPMDHGSISLFYRRDFFKEAGLDPDKPPKTWEEVAEFGKKLTKRDAGGRVVRAGWGWEARSLPSHFYYWGVLLPQKGGDFLSTDGSKSGLDNVNAMAAFQCLYDTYHTHRISALGLAPVISPIDDFGSGVTAMINSGFWLPPALEAKYPAVTYKDGVYGIARLPQFAGGKAATRLNPWIWMVSAHSKVQKEAWQFVAYMSGTQANQTIWLEQAQYIQPRLGSVSPAVLEKIPYAKVFFEDLKIGVPTPRTPKFAQLAGAVAKAYDRIAANAERPDAVVPDLSKGIDRLLED